VVLRVLAVGRRVVPYGEVSVAVGYRGVGRSKLERIGVDTLRVVFFVIFSLRSIGSI
jgi:hypothetical protein